MAVEDNSHKSGKVTEKNFSDPDIFYLATASKHRIRTVMAFETPFLPKTQAERLDFLWKVVVDTAQTSDSPQLVKALHKASRDIKMKANLTTYVCIFHIQSMI